MSSRRSSRSCRRMTTSTGRSGSTGSARTTWAALSSSPGRPTPHQPKDKDDEDYGHPWLYSGVIRISVQTEPFSPVPRVHLSTGIRRWVHGKVWPASGNSASVYLRTEGQWLSGGTTTSRFAVAPIRARWGRGEKKDEVTATWALGGPADILSRLSIGQDFPKPEDLARDAEGWIRGTRRRPGGRGIPHDHVQRPWRGHRDDAVRAAPADAVGGRGAAAPLRAAGRAAAAAGTRSERPCRQGPSPSAWAFRGSRRERRRPRRSSRSTRPSEPRPRRQTP